MAAKRIAAMLALSVVLDACSATPLAASVPTYGPTHSWRTSTPEAQGVDSSQRPLISACGRCGRGAGSRLGGLSNSRAKGPLQALSPARVRWFRLAGSAVAGIAAVLLVASIFLNLGALRIEDWMVSDDAFEAFAIGASLALAVCVLELRSALRDTDRSPGLRAILAASLSVVAVIGAFLALAEPSVFNAGYQCLGNTKQIWLAVVMRPTPATCGYLIPTSDDSLFYPAALTASVAAALGVVSALLIVAGRTECRLRA